MRPSKQILIGHLPFLVKSGHFAIIDKEVAICHLAMKWPFTIDKLIFESLLVTIAMTCKKKHYSLLYFIYKYVTETLYSNSYWVKNHKCKNLVKEVGI